LEKRALWILCLCQGLLTAGLALSFPFFALYLNKTRGVPMGWVGAFLSLSLLASAASHGWGGDLSDRLGRRRVMEAALWGRGLLTGGLAAAVWSGGPVWTLVLLHVLASLVGFAFAPAARSWIADHVGPDERLRAYGWLRVALNLGWAVGPAVGGRLAGWSYAGMFLATALACGLCALLTRSLREADEVPAQAKAPFHPADLFSAARDPRFLHFSLYALLIGIVMAQLVVPLSVHAVTYGGLSDAQVGLLFSLNGILVVATQNLVTRLISRGRLTTALTAGCLLYALGYVSVGFFSGLPALAAAMVVVSLGEVTVSPSLQALMANLAPVDLKGRYVGFASFMEQIGVAGGPLLGGVLQQRLSPRWPAAPWLAVGAVGVLAAAGFYGFGRRLTVQEEGLKGVELYDDRTL
jgi:MFS family permease